MQRFYTEPCQPEKPRMKKMQFLNLLFLLFVFACSKPDNINPQIIEDSVLGKWYYTEYFSSTGGQGQWHPVTQPNQVVEFKPNGSFVPADAFLKDVRKFELVDSVTIKFQPASTPSGYLLMRYSLGMAGRDLYLYPVNPACIEGCGYKFSR